MLEILNLGRTLGRKEFEDGLPALQRRLYDLEKACWDNKISSLLVFEGWDAAGKGGAIATLTQRLDPRGFKMHATTPPRTHELGYPWLRRFWLKVPNRGEMAIFDRSWYTRVLDEVVDGKIAGAQQREAFRDIVEFERMLADDGTAILKFFLHISQKEQARRFRKIESDPLEAWRVTKEDKTRHRNYGQYLLAVEEMLERTESEFAPWHIIEATSRWYARRKIFHTVIAALESRLGTLAPAAAPVTKAERRHDAELRAAIQKLEPKRGKKAEQA